MFDNISKVCFFDFEMCLIFSRNFFRNKLLLFFCSEFWVFICFLCCDEFALPTVCKTFCSRTWNSTLFPAAIHFCSTNSWISFKSSSNESFWDNLANSTAVQRFDNGPVTNQFPPSIFSRTLPKSRFFCFFLSLSISFTKSSRVFIRMYIFWNWIFFENTLC